MADVHTKEQWASTYFR